MRSALWIGLASALAGSIASTEAYKRFRRELTTSEVDLGAGSQLAYTDAGPIEYAKEGRGMPALVIHGAGGGYDQGLMLGRGSFGPDTEIVAPSRFGYLRTPIPEDASPAAQADAHAALLDALGIERPIVFGASAGAPSAIELALRHPARVSALILLVPRAYSPDAQVGPVQSGPNVAVANLIMAGTDFAFWLAMRLARPALVRFLGVPPAVEARAPAADRAHVTAIIRSILPLSRRLKGLEVDSAADIRPWPLERITAPTLIISAEDDLMLTAPCARFTAGQIPGAELKLFESGGHLLVSRDAELRATIADFLERHQERTVRIAA